MEYQHTKKWVRGSSIYLGRILKKKNYWGILKEIRKGITFMNMTRDTTWKGPMGGGNVLRK